MFSCEIYEIFQNTFLQNTAGCASVIIKNTIKKLKYWWLTLPCKESLSLSDNVAGNIKNLKRGKLVIKKPLKTPNMWTYYKMTLWSEALVCFYYLVNKIMGIVETKKF